MSFFNLLTISGPNQIDSLHQNRFTPEDSTAQFLEQLFRYDNLSPLLRRSDINVTPVFIQKIAYDFEDLDIILNPCKAAKVTNINFLNFTGHASEGKFWFLSKGKGKTKCVGVMFQDLLKTITKYDAKNIMVSGCDWLPKDSRGREYELKKVFKNNTSCKLFIGLSAPNRSLYNRDLLSVVANIYCTIFDKFIYREKAKKDKNLGSLIIKNITEIYNPGYLKKCGISIMWKDKGARNFKYWDCLETT